MSNKQRQRQHMATAGERWAGTAAACCCVCPGLGMRKLMSSKRLPAPLPTIVSEILLD